MTHTGSFTHFIILHFSLKYTSFMSAKCLTNMLWDVHFEMVTVMSSLRPFLVKTIVQSCVKLPVESNTLNC